MSDNLLSAIVGLSCGMLMALPFLCWALWRIRQFLHWWNKFTKVDREALVAMWEEKS